MHFDFNSFELACPLIHDSALERLTKVVSVACIVVSEIDPTIVFWSSKPVDYQIQTKKVLCVQDSSIDCEAWWIMQLYDIVTTLPSAWVHRRRASRICGQTSRTTAQRSNLHIRRCWSSGVRTIANLFRILSLCSFEQFSIWAVNTLELLLLDPFDLGWFDHYFNLIL